MKNIKLLAIALIIAAIFSISIISVSAAEAEVGENALHSPEESNGTTEDTPLSYARITYSEEYYLAGGEVALVLSAELDSEIEDIIFEGEGFTLEDDFSEVEGEIHFSVLHDISDDTPYLKLRLILADGSERAAELYGTAVQGLLFVNDVYYSMPKDEYLESILADIAEQNPDNLPLGNMSTTMGQLGGGDAVSTSSNTSLDTTVTGQIIWYDDEYDASASAADRAAHTHPYQFGKVELWDDQTNGDRKLFTAYTDLDGRYTFTFNNDMGSSENGYDLYIKVYAAGEYVSVGAALNLTSVSTFEEGSHYNVQPGNHDFGIHSFDMNNPSGEFIQIAQIAIYGSKYYEAMKGSTVTHANIVYITSGTSEGAYYTRSSKSIHLWREIGSMTNYSSTYEACDVILHEYGHHVAYEENIIDVSLTPGGRHSGAMAEHYHNHFETSVNYCSLGGCTLSPNTTLFTEEECKYRGCLISWSEGYATYFGMIAQSYSTDNYLNSTVRPNLRFFDDEKYSGINGAGSTIETNTGLTEDNEWLVLCLLYDMFDAKSTSDHDNISLGHDAMWQYITGSDATTLYEFINYFKENHNIRNDISAVGKLLEDHGLTVMSLEIIESTITTEPPTIQFIWGEDPDLYYSNRKVQINFYDSQYDKILSILINNLAPYCINSYYYQIPISDLFWQDILNETDRTFYLTATLFEYGGEIGNTSDDPYITGYETEYVCYSLSDAYSTLSYNGSSTKTLSSGGYFWYKFTVPATENYVFSSSGSTDTYIEVFPNLVVGRSTTGRIAYNDDGANNGRNFSLSMNLTSGDVIYIRVRGYNWTATGQFTISVSSTNHTHSYTYNYGLHSHTQHRAYCVCGDSTLQAHDFKNEFNGNRCKRCAYFTSSLIPDIKDNIEINEPDNIGNIPYGKEEQYI